MTAASRLAPLTHLPPTMVLPGKKQVQKVLNGEVDVVEKPANSKVGEE